MYSFPNLDPVVKCRVVTIASWPAYRFLRRQVRWCLLKNFLQFVVTHTVKCFGVVKKAEVGVFPEFSWFFDDPVAVGNLISGSSAFSKSILDIFKFKVHILLKPGLENFEHYLASMWNEMTGPYSIFFFYLGLQRVGWCSLHFHHRLYLVYWLKYWSLPETLSQTYPEKMFYQLTLWASFTLFKLT